MGNEIKKILPKHFEILNLFLEGYSRKEVAQATGKTEAGIGLIFQSPIFQHELARRRREQEMGVDKDKRQDIRKARQMLEHAAVRAVEVHEEIMQGGEEVDRRTMQISAEAILDRVFPKAVAAPSSGRGGGGPVVIISGDKLNNLQIALGEAFPEEEELPKQIPVDIEPVSVEEND